MAKILCVVLMLLPVLVLAQTWVPALGEYGNVNTLTWEGRQTNVFFAATETGIYKNTKPYNFLNSEFVGDQMIFFSMSQKNVSSVFCYDGLNIFFAVLNDGSFWCTRDRGASWDTIMSSGVLSAMKDAFGNVYAATMKGLYRSTDVGAKFSKIAVAFTSGAVRNVDVDSLTGDLYAVTDDGVFRNDASGNSKIIFYHAGLSLVRVNCHTGYIFAASDEGLWVSSNSAQNWILYNSAKVTDIQTSSVGTFIATNAGICVFDGKAIKSLSLSGRFKAILLGHNYFGQIRLVAGGERLWIADNPLKPAVLISPLETAIPAEFCFLGNFPNPFNPVTTITYQIPRRMKVSICVYNGLGQLIEGFTIADEEVGTHCINWNGTDRPSGVYFVKMTATGYAPQILKINLLK